MAAKPSNWTLKGELALSCNCDLFCPCVVSLGAAAPTHGYCQGWMAIRIDEGKYGRTNIGGVNIAFLLDIPGRMGEGGWSVGLYIDDKASAAQAKAIETIVTGAAGGPPTVLKFLIANHLGTQRVPVTYEEDGKARTVTAGKAIMGSVDPIQGENAKKPVTLENSTYWIAPDVIIGQGRKSRVRDFGRVWNFDGKSAELCAVDWSGPS